MYAFQMGQKTNGKSPFEKLYGRKPNTVKSNVVEQNKIVSEAEPRLAFGVSGFEEQIDSMILVQLRTKGPKLEGPYKRNLGKC